MFNTVNSQGNATEEKENTNTNITKYAMKMSGSGQLPPFFSSEASMILNLCLLSAFPV